VWETRTMFRIGKKMEKRRMKQNGVREDDGEEE
jgi:hypothetical protein